MSLFYLTNRITGKVVFSGIARTCVCDDGKEPLANSVASIPTDANSREQIFEDFNRHWSLVGLIESKSTGVRTSQFTEETTEECLHIGANTRKIFDNVTFAD